VVLPEYRGGGVGYELKLAQRRAAIRQGIRLVTWTFDPLLSLNAHLNLRKLGCVSQSYFVDLYGTSERGGLATLGWSDRLRVDWWVTSRRVERRLAGDRGDLTLKQYLEGNATLINPTAPPQGAYPAVPAAGECRTTFGLVEIPLEMAALRRDDPELARGWQTHIREVFTYLFRRGYVVTDFLRSNYEGRERGFYLLSFDLNFDRSLN
jgi:predicted GNAT superfamily acetyltransferase